MVEIKFSIFGETKTINYGSLLFDKEDLTTEQLNELFDNDKVKNNVTHLQLTNCNITELPDSIGGLKKLENLYLHDSEIDSFNRDTIIKEMNFKPNSFTTLPKSLASLPKLKKIYLYGNENLLANEHNVAILGKIYKKQIKIRSKPDIRVDNLFGGTDVTTGRNTKTNPNKKLNNKRLLDDNFEELSTKLGFNSIDELVDHIFNEEKDNIMN